MERVIKFDGGVWWFAGNSNLKFQLTKFAITSFEDLKRIFKFKRDNFLLKKGNITIKKIGYNFYINNKKCRKKDVLEVLDEK